MEVTDSGNASDARGPLTGLRVVDAATMFAGPFACQLLGDMGAEVVKVEHPGRGDTLRGHGAQKSGAGLWWKVVGRNKRSVAIDLHSKEGADLLVRLASKADVLVESFRPGTMERWGLSYERLCEENPGLIMLRVSGFGQTGPYARRPGYGTLAEAMSGFAAMTGPPGTPPVLPPFGLADGVAGLAGAMSILAAVRYREVAGGQGQVIDLAILEPLLSLLGPQATVWDQLGNVQARLGNRSVNNAPRNTYRTKDGQWVAVSASSANIARRIMELVGRPELAEESWFATGAGRSAHGDELDVVVADWIERHSLDEVVASFEEAEAAIAPVYDIVGLATDRHAVEREVFTRVEDDELGPVLMQNVMTRFSASPGRIRFAGRPLGSDTDRVLMDMLGLGCDEIEELRRSSVIR